MGDEEWYESKADAVERRNGRVANTPDVQKRKFKVAGVSFDTHPRVIATLQPGTTVYLVDEPTNTHDKQAVKVETCSGHKFGYVPRDLAAAIQSGKPFSRGVCNDKRS